ncbi:MAG TPA: hypothetical protein VN832_01595 [Stellaceae bacterium]|nr:hypothetical protein [Stellaceae bacterium]
MKHFTLNLGARVLLGLGAIGIVLGVTAALGASRYPLHQARLERWAGALIVIGLSLVGLAVPML